MVTCVAKNANMCVRKNAIQEGDMRRSTYDRLEMVYQKFKGYIGTPELLLDVATARTDRSLLSMNFPITRHYFSTNNY